MSSLLAALDGGWTAVLIAKALSLCASDNRSALPVEGLLSATPLRQNSQSIRLCGMSHRMLQSAKEPNGLPDPRDCQRTHEREGRCGDAVCRNRYEFGAQLMLRVTRSGCHAESGYHQHVVVTADNEGIRTMITGLVPALVRADPTSCFRLICSAANASLFSSVSDDVDITLVKQRRRRPLMRIAHDQLSVPWLVRRNTDLLLTPSTVGSMLAPVPQVVVVVADLALPSVRREAGGVTLSAVHRAYYGPVMRLSHRRADAVVTISRFLAERLLSDTKVSPAKVWPIPLGIDPPSSPLGAQTRRTLTCCSLAPLSLQEPEISCPRGRSARPDSMRS